MLALLMANNVILGRLKFSEVPRLLKEPTAKQLIDAGAEWLIDDESFLT